MTFGWSPSLRHLAGHPAYDIWLVTFGWAYDSIYSVPLFFWLTIKLAYDSIYLHISVEYL